MNYWKDFQGQGLVQKINAYLCIHVGVNPEEDQKSFLKAATGIARLPRELLTFQTVEDFCEDVFFKIEPLQKKFKTIHPFTREFTHVRSDQTPEPVDVVMSLSWGVAMILLNEKINETVNSESLEK